MNEAKDLRKYELQLQVDPREVGEFAYKLLIAVAEFQWDTAMAAVKAYRDLHPHPQYVRRTGRLFEHCEELILAIKAKKTFPNLHSLSQNKQEELHEKAKEHWDELKASLRRLKLVERTMALEDARSTVWVVKTFAFCCFGLMAILLFREAYKTLGAPLMIYVNEFQELILKSMGM